MLLSKKLLSKKPLSKATPLKRPVVGAVTTSNPFADKALARYFKNHNFYLLPNSKALRLRLARWSVLAVFGLLANTLSFAGNIEVTLTDDIVASDEECGLREAVEFLNAGGTNTKHDCYPEDERVNRVIQLEAESETAYVLNDELRLTSSMKIEADNVFNIRNNNAEKQPIILSKSGRAFVIDDGSAFSEGMSVSLEGIYIKGAFADDAAKPTSVSLDEGGLIFNRENLLLKQMHLEGGAARKGGAVYSASTDASLTIELTEFKGNYANQGAAVFSETMNASAQNSLFHLNGGLTDSVSDTTNSNINADKDKPFAFYVEVANRPTSIPRYNNRDELAPDDDFYRVTAIKSLSNSIFFDNRTGAFVMQSPMLVNNVTVIGNDRGVLFDNQFELENPSQRQVITAQLANSVLLGNAGYDIKADADDRSFINHIVFNKLKGSRDIGDFKQADSVTRLSDAQVKDLLAVDTISQEGETIEVCRAPTLGETTGLFCPLVRLEEEFLPTLRPRLLMSYQSLSDSPIVNKAANVIQSGDNPRNQTCEAKDIRDETRSICDIGAFELVINKESSSLKEANAEISFGETAYINLKDALGDGELVPSGYCEEYFKVNGLQSLRSTDPVNWPSGKVGQWSDGCLLYMEGKSPQKGKLEVNQATNQLVYVPESNWHGADVFEYQVVTTTSRFSDSPNEQALRVRTVVRQDPPDDFKSRTIELGYKEGSGGLGLGMLALLSLLSLFGVGTCRVRK